MKPRILIAVFAIFLSLCFPLVGADGKITVSNTSKSMGDGRWDWTIFIKAEKPVLDKIQCVEYTLHPSFPNPIRKVCSAGIPAQAFALSSNGWGTFAIKVRVLYRDNSVQQLQYNLVLK
jgi:transcription initiation factor IIF auxiliary subunit